MSKDQSLVETDIIFLEKLLKTTEAGRHTSSFVANRLAVSLLNLGCSVHLNGHVSNARRN